MQRQRTLPYLLDLPLFTICREFAVPYLKSKTLSKRLLQHLDGTIIEIRFEFFQQKKNFPQRSLFNFYAFEVLQSFTSSIRFCNNQKKYLKANIELKSITYDISFPFLVNTERIVDIYFITKKAKEKYFHLKYNTYIRKPKSTFLL